MTPVALNPFRAPTYAPGSTLSLRARLQIAMEFRQMGHSRLQVPGLGFELCGSWRQLPQGLVHRKQIQQNMRTPRS